MYDRDIRQEINILKKFVLNHANRVIKPHHANRVIKPHHANSVIKQPLFQNNVSS